MKITEILKIIKGVFLSFVFIFIFGFFIYGAEFFLSLGDQNKNIFLGAVSGMSFNENVNNNPVLPEVQQEKQIEELNVNAESAISVESNLLEEDKTLFEKNSEAILPIASLTKLMTAVISLDNYDLLQKITISEKADTQAPLITDVKKGDVFSTTDLLYITLVESSNKSAYALAEQMGVEKFVALMNQRASQLGMKNTFYADPTGLSAENVSTATDLVKLIKYIVKNYPEISQISRTKEYEVPNFGKITNTNQLLGEMPQIVCGKTGFTTVAKGCLILVTNSQNSSNLIINVILGSDDRFLEMKKMVDWSNATCNQ